LANARVTTLYKNSGVITLGPIDGELEIYGGIQAGIYSNNIITATSTVTFKYAYGQNYAPNLYFATYPITQSLRSLVVETSAVFSFGAHEVAGNRFLILGDLVIDQRNLFTISWYFSDTHLLVRKDSQHLRESLSRIRFSQYPNKPAGVKEYDAHYFEIGPGFPDLPEPATYGAILGAAGLGLWTWRKRRAAVVRPAGARQ